MLFICLMGFLAASLAFYCTPSVPRLKLFPFAMGFLVLDMGVAGVGGLGSPLPVSLLDPKSACGEEK
jgi:hypothetical protein